MLRLLIAILLIVGLFSGQAVAASSSRVQGIRIFLNQGNPEQAIDSAESLLMQPHLTEEERLALLKLIAEAEEFRAVTSHFQDVSKAVAAIQTLIKEFPKQINEPELLWKSAWLHWRKGAKKLALTVARDVKTRFPDSSMATKAWLLMARIHIELKKINLARNDLLQYGIRVEDESREQALGNVWIAVIDYEDSRFKEALNWFDSVYQTRPEIIELEERLFATYIQVLFHQGMKDDALALADKFLQRYTEGEYVPVVRLLRADIRHGEEGVDYAALQKEYEIIANNEAETDVGKKAFMRKVMLQYRDSHDYKTLKPVIIALKRIANQNQFSEIENESILNQARLWVRLAEKDPENAPEQAVIAALEDYARVSVSTYKKLAVFAVNEGREAFIKNVEDLIAQSKWVQVVVTWERFPQLRPMDKHAVLLQFGVARALRMLMEYEQSEALLNQLYKQAGGSVWGHKVMLERARLWLDRGDADGVKEVMVWLNENEFTLYRPEMLLLAAQMQLKQGNASAASQTIVSVGATDVALETRGEYWKTRAKIAEKLLRWHVAAGAWREFGKSPGADRGIALMEEANSLFRAQEYRKAENLFSKFPEMLQTPAWRYRYSICQIKTGKWRQAVERLALLKSDADAGVYASMAALTLAERKADELLAENP